MGREQWGKIRMDYRVEAVETVRLTKNINGSAEKVIS